ncbi:MAG: Holliday junction branch migration protein RuvA [Lachnospiraceae bacterium]|jgi:Holliday junction DNA helicase RuvA
MIAYLKGKYAGKTPDSVIIDHQGMGVEIQVPQTVFSELPPVGEEVKIYTFLRWTNDGPSLYGFAAKDEREIFQMLINVSGLGPKGALTLLSFLSTDELRFAVLSEDVRKISKAPGIGPKTAKRIILELKDKLKIETTQPDEGIKAETSAKGEAGTEARDDAIEAMVALGFGSTDAYRAVQSLGDLSGMDSEQILKAAMKKLV